MSNGSFVHLHCHTHYSLLDGAAKIGNLVNKAKETGMNALAITDHGNMCGAIEFYNAAKAAEINPIIGYEAYIAPGNRTDRQYETGQHSSYHLTLLAKNRTGFNNLLKMSSAAYLEGFYRKPRIDKALLEEFNEGIICLSGCVAGELSRQLLAGEGTDEPYEDALETAQWFHKLFGDRYYIEIQNNGVAIQQRAMRMSVEIANRVGLPLVATSDTHYVNQGDAEAQDVMMCINMGRFRADTNRMKMEGDQFYLRSPEDMYNAFPEHADAVARSQEIADQVDIELDLTKRHFPSYTIPDEKKPAEYLRELCIEGLLDRYSDQPDRLVDGELTDEVIARLDHELNIINTLGFPNYFLIVWDFVRHSRELGIPTTARGSGVGALVSYALYLSHVCPLKYDLLFERFLDPSRVEAPDIDIDFCKDRRGEIIRYVKDKYGEENVAQIGTFGTLKARAAINDVGRVLGLPQGRVAQITSHVPIGPKVTLSGALESNADLKKMYDEEEEVREVIDLALRIEGMARNMGTHAAAVVIADKPLINYVPLCRVTGKTDIITQWSMADVEAAGLLKMDFLGLKNLTNLSKAIGLIKQTTGEDIDPYKFPLDDQDTYDLLCRGETKGVFQLESGGIRDLLQKMKPDCFHDIIATAALYRPGPLEGGMVDTYVRVKHGREEAHYDHEILEEVLNETHGVMVYQEQVMRILNRLGGIELANAYKCIKAISKKKEKTMREFQEQFIAGAVDKGVAKKVAENLWNMIEKFAGYGFNKSHSTAYALIAYMTAYLKAHYSVEFMAALLCGDITERNFKRKDSLVEHLEDCQRMDIEVVPPDVNTSGREFTVDADKRIHFGMSAIKGCGGAAADAIVAAREADGPFKDIFDFCERVESTDCNRSAIQTLIKAGAFDSTGARRSQMMAVVERAIQLGVKAQADRRSGQMSLFGSGGDEDESAPPVSLPKIVEWEEKEILSYEKEVLGFYLSSHPLAEYETLMSTYCTHGVTDLDEVKHKSEILVAGMLAALKFSHTKNPRKPGGSTKYVMFDLEDTKGYVRCIMWPSTFEKFGELVKPDAIVAIRASVERRDGSEEVNLFVNELIPIEHLDARYTRGVQIELDEQKHTLEDVKRLKEVTRLHPGRFPLEIVVTTSKGNRVGLNSKSVTVDVDVEFRRRVDDLLTPGHFSLLTAKPKVKPPPERKYGRRSDG